ncbi:MAG: RagB/SusD family nutrient uptake outer membrane protein [Daejeonella sp.]
MKRLLYALVVVLGITVSCKKSEFLKESPEDRYVVGNFYSGSKDAQAAVDAVYNQLYSIYSRNMLLMNDLPADDHKNGLGMPNQFLQDLEFLRYTSENTFVTNMWQINYSGIQRANIAINNIGGITMDKALQSRLIGEASFLRALYYFNLVRFYGDVPLILKLDKLGDALIGRSPKKDVYGQIIKDLQFAEANLPKKYNSVDIGRATSGAAKILMGKVYLTMNEFQKSADKLAEVVDNEAAYGYGLHTNFRDNWFVATENGKEMVFSIDYMGPPGLGNGQMGLEGPKYSVPGGSVPGITGSNEADIPTRDLYTQYISGDTRKDVTFKLDYISPANGKKYTSSIPLFAKYWEEGQPITGNSKNNMYILRYSDALLMYAEALNETGKIPKALEVLNRVRARAFKGNSQNYSGLTQAGFRDKVYLERRLELANEGQRWFDLVRTKRFVNVMKAHGILEAKLAEKNKTIITENTKDYQVLYPIPQREIDLNKLMTQNPGW